MFAKTSNVNEKSKGGKRQKKRHPKTKNSSTRYSESMPIAYKVFKCLRMMIAFSERVLYNL